jgi:hypothetical protein
MKCNNDELKAIWNDLQDILLHYKHFNTKMEERLLKLGIRCYHTGSHAKLVFNINGVEKSIGFSKSPSDKYCGRQILRDIRRLFNGTY